MITKILNKLKKQKNYIRIGKCGIIEPTAIDKGIDNKYTRMIVIYNWIKVKNNLITYGKKIDEIPYTEEEAKNLTKIKKIPLVVRKVNNKVQIEQGSSFGEIIN